MERLQPQPVNLAADKPERKQERGELIEAAHPVVRFRLWDRESKFANKLRQAESDLRRVVAQVWSEPAFDIFHRRSLACGVIFDLILAD